MTVKKYTIGFVLSLMLTLLAYSLVVNGYSGIWLLVGLGVLAVVQMIVQLIFFLHLGEELRPRYKILSFIFMAGALAIIVVGSIWIMENLNYNMSHMSPEEKDKYMRSQFDKGF